MTVLELPPAPPAGAAGRTVTPSPKKRIAGVIAGIWIAGLLATFATAVYLVHRPPVYLAQVEVLFLAPKSTANPNGLQITPSSLVATAGVVAQMVNRSDTTTRVVSQDVTLSGEGIHKGSSVTLPNDGGQWSNVYDQAVLDVQVVGSSESAVVSQAVNLTGKINAALAVAQKQQKVAAVNLIRTQLSPPEPNVFRQSGSRMRVALATLVLGCGLTAALARFARRRANRRAFAI